MRWHFIESATHGHVAAFPASEPPRYFPIRIDHDGRFLKLSRNQRRGRARPETYVFTGVHILNRNVFRFVPKGEFYEINDQVYPQAIRQGEKVLGFPVEGYWNDVGDPSRYLEAQKDLLLLDTPERFREAQSNSQEKRSYVVGRQRRWGNR